MSAYRTEEEFLAAAAAACRRGDAKALAALLKSRPHPMSGRGTFDVRMRVPSGVGLAASDWAGGTLLHLVRTGACVELLLEHNAQVDAPDKGYRTPLMFACERGDLSVVRTLLARGASPGSQDVEDSSPLHRAAMHGPKLIQAVLEAGGRLESRDFLGRTPLWIACEQRNHAGVQYLLGRGANANTRDSQKVHVLSMAYRDKRAATLLIAGGADTHQAFHAKGPQGPTAIEEVILEGDATALATMLGLGANPNVTTSDGHTLLSRAIAQGEVKCLEVLLKAGADPNAASRTKQLRYPLEFAVTKHFETLTDATRRTVVLLVKYGAALGASTDGPYSLQQALDTAETEAGPQTRRWLKCIYEDALAERTAQRSTTLTGASSPARQKRPRL